MKLGILTDSTCDIPQSLVEQHNIEVVPSILILDGKEYADGTGISRADFYARLPGLNSRVSTSAPSIGEFAARYRKLMDQNYEHILSIHAAGSLTSILSSAQQAAAEFPGRITLVDSRSASLGLGFQVLAASEAADEGLEAALAAVEATRARLSVVAALDTLEYARRSGRLSGVITGVGNLLSVKPLIELRGGEVEILAALRTAKQAEERMLTILKHMGKLQRLALLHTGVEPRARAFLSELMKAFSLALPREILMVNVTTVIGVHVGPNGLGFAAVGME